MPSHTHTHTHTRTPTQHTCKYLLSLLPVELVGRSQTSIGRGPSIRSLAQASVEQSNVQELLQLTESGLLAVGVEVIQNGLAALSMFMHMLVVRLTFNGFFRTQIPGFLPCESGSSKRPSGTVLMFMHMLD
jgi:hypothetical protein